MKVVAVLAGLAGFAIALVITLAISFLPTIIAFIRGNTYKRQVLIYQLIMAAGSVAVGIGVSICALFIPVFATIASLISTVWGLFSLVAWGYILINAIRDDEMTILSMIGINI